MRPESEFDYQPGADGYFVFRLPGSVVAETIGSSPAAAGLGSGATSVAGTNTFMFLPSAKSPTDYQFPIVGINFNLWGTLGDIGKGIGNAIDGIGKILRPNTPTIPTIPTGPTPTTPSADKPVVPGTGSNFIAVPPLTALEIAAVVAAVGIIAYLMMSDEQRRQVAEQLGAATDRIWNNTRDRLYGTQSPTVPGAVPNGTQSPTVPGAVPSPPGTIPVPVNPTTPTTPTIPTLPFDPGQAPPLVVNPGGAGTQIGTPTRPGTQAPAIPAVVPGTPAAPATPDTDPDTSDPDTSDPDGDKEHQTYPGGGIIGAGLGGAAIETPGLPTTPGTATPGAPNGSPTPTPTTTIPLDPDHGVRDPNKPDKATPVETKPAPTTQTNPILGIAQGILNFFFPQPKTPEPTTPAGPGQPGSTTPGTGTATANNEGGSETSTPGNGEGTPGTKAGEADTGQDRNPDGTFAGGRHGHEAETQEFEDYRKEFPDRELITKKQNVQTQNAAGETRITVPDGYAQLPDGNWAIIEVKSGTAALTPGQKMLQEQIKREGSVNLTIVDDAGNQRQITVTRYDIRNVPSEGGASQ